VTIEFKVECSSLYDIENRLLPNDYIMIRNHGEDKESLREGLRGMQDQQGHPSQDGGPNQVDFEHVSESTWFGPPS
jgi:hypothetical protein